MFRLVMTPPPRRHFQRWREAWARLLAPLTIWLCVSVSLRYGYYGDCRMMLGPSSSRLMKASSVFVEQIEVRDEDKKGVLLYAFSEKPELSYQANWNVSNYVIVRSYSRKGFSLWLNNGSMVHVRLEAPTSAVNKLEVVMIKGEQTFNRLLPKLTSLHDAPTLKEPINGDRSMTDEIHIWLGKGAEFSIEEDDRYYLGIINTNPRSIIMSMTVNVSAKIYDTSKANSMCSTTSGSCRLNLLFPNIHYVILTTPNNGDLGGWYIELSFAARMLTYIAILGLIVIIAFLILKYLEVCDLENATTITEVAVIEEREATETDPIMPVKQLPYKYGTGEEEEDLEALSSSSEELYDSKLCVICYDEQRNCFFVPCGHCATCYDCAQRIMEGESNLCPICRRLIHKLRRLFHS